MCPYIIVLYLLDIINYFVISFGIIFHLILLLPVWYSHQKYDILLMYPLLVDYQYYAVIKVEINGDAFRKPFYS